MSTLCEFWKFEVGPSLIDIFWSFLQDENGVMSTWGDIETKKRYSHIDLIHMIDGFDGERGAVTAGGRGYYLKVTSSVWF